MLQALALPNDTLLETKDHVGPIALLRGDDSESNLRLAAAITLRYSDAPKDFSGVLMVQKNGANTEISTSSITESEYLRYRI